MFLRYSGESQHEAARRSSAAASRRTSSCPTAPTSTRAAEAAAWGIFYNQGEVCNAGSRLLVHESIKDDFLERVVKVAATIHPGDPLDPDTRMGAIVDQTQLERVLGYIESGTHEGASLQLGGARVRRRPAATTSSRPIFDAVVERR